MIKRLLFLGVIIFTLNGCTTLFYQGYKAANHPLPITQQLGDKVISSKAHSILMNYPGLGYVRDIHILVFNAELLIVGEVPSHKIRRGLVRKLSQIGGVKRVYNYLVVSQSYTKKMSQSDTILDVKIEAVLADNRLINTHHYYFVVYRGVVYIFGQAPQSNRKYTTGLISHVSGVKKVLTFF